MRHTSIIIVRIMKMMVMMMVIVMMINLIITSILIVPILICIQWLYDQQCFPEHQGAATYGNYYY